MRGSLSWAAVAGPPLPSTPVSPVPAMVVMTPVAASTRRILSLPESAMSRFQLASKTMPFGPSRWAALAGPPSPSSPGFPPSPTTVVMMPLAWSTLRITSLAESAM